jgi:2-octaprenylphenol hydroxylase
MMSSRSGDFDVIIVGAGVIGAVMACLLLARKLSTPGRVAIVADHFAADPVGDSDWDLRVFALSRASERLLKICDVWRALPAARVFAYERMCVWDAGGTPQGEGSLTFDCAQIGDRSALSPRGAQVRSSSKLPPHRPWRAMRISCCA